MEFTYQRMVELTTKDPGLSTELEIARARLSFPCILESREDSLIGRGHHESYHVHSPTGRVVCFLWDEDHDERLFIAAQELYSRLNSNGQTLIMILGERKGALTIVTTNENAKRSLDLNLVDCEHVIDGGGDPWLTEVTTTDFAHHSVLISDAPEVVQPYIQNILDTRDALQKLQDCQELRAIEVAARKKKLKVNHC